ncbi:MAG TPA: DNA repair protein RecN [Sneathiellales bacterium]|jgi:DNA repair protein RecN (Recombination protein N)|nr:DNA repair protein RecN [Sneathiellales bacterium]
MFVGLTVRNILLIDRLDLQLGQGLCALTGETGAGKSIILGSLGLATGARADSTLVRSGQDQGVVTAEFEAPSDHPARIIMRDQGLEEDGQDHAGNLLLRRVLTADGRSRAFVNDQPVSIGLLRSIGECLIEYHGQHDDRGLLNAVGHRSLLDQFGGHGDLIATVAKCFDALQTSTSARLNAEQEAENARADEAYVRHVLAELDELDPQSGEEETLATDRSFLQHGSKLADEFSSVLSSVRGEEGADALLRSALRRLQRVLERVEGGETRFADLLATLERASIEAMEAVAALDVAAQSIEHDPARLERTEERLFALRAAARKHQCNVEELVHLRQSLGERLKLIDGGEERIADLVVAEKKAEKKFSAGAARLGKARSKAAVRLDKAVNGELSSLKLGKAKFHTSVAEVSSENWSSAGTDRVEFQVSTNPGAPLGSLSRIASGGELSRLLLALKVVLAGEGEAASLVFDEIDRGIGGAVADAVGERLARLARQTQVLVVTHSPQVAAQANHHWRINKDGIEADDTGVDGGGVFTRIERLDSDARREEIARMLSGAIITDEARAAADRLLDNDANVA